YPRTAPADGTVPDGWDEIPGARGCTPEACSFRDHHQDLLAAGAAGVYGLSAQDTDYQREVVERLHLPFALLADPGLVLARAQQLPTFTAAWIALYRRHKLVNRDGSIDYVFFQVCPPGENAGEIPEWLLTAA